MAHFAELDSENKVIRVIVVHNNELFNHATQQEEENLGIAFCQRLFGADTTWKQTSYNGNFRKQFSGINFTYDPAKDIFIAPQPYASWSLNETSNWVAPIDQPDDGKSYRWDESAGNWVENT